MIIGSRDTFIGIKRGSVIDTVPFSHFEVQQNFILQSLTSVEDTYIQTGQDPPL